MTCPSCGGELEPGAARCPVCDAVVAPRVEGALAQDPRLLTPPARGRARSEPTGTKAEPIREIPGRRRRDGREPGERAERSWRDEVQERVRSRRQKRVAAGLPLFEQQPAASEPAGRATPHAVPALRPPAEPAATGQPEARQPGPPPVARGAAGADAGPGPGEGIAATPGLSDAELEDLPLRSSAAVPAGPLDLDSDAARRTDLRASRPSLEGELLAEAELEQQVGMQSQSPEPSPLERPARAGERAQAAAFDLALLTAIATVVVYFSSRAARVELATLLAAWPWLLGFLCLLAAFYAGYFTGTTGQTPGKLLTGLRVVDSGGRPPRYPRALARALVGLVGVALAGAGLVTMAFDPAGRALHDRLFRTRVVRR